MEKMDLLSPGDAERVVRRAAPDAIIHAAALIDVDLCEREPALAERINAEGARLIASLASERGARLVYCSTDMVFDGSKGMYREEDAAEPINHYGRTKLAGEGHSLLLCPGAVVARLSLLHGWGNEEHQSFFEVMLQRVGRDEPVRLFTAQFRTPTCVGDVCRAVERILEKPECEGIYHIAGPERVNRYEFGLRAAEIFGFPRELLIPVRMSDLREFIPRPADTSLDSRKAERELGLRFRGVAESLRASAEERGG